MNIEKLIESLQNAAGGPEGIKMCHAAATALSTLQTENERLRAAVDNWKKKYVEANGKWIEAENKWAGLDKAVRNGTVYRPMQEELNLTHEENQSLKDAIEKLRAELEQVKRERDAAVSDLTFVVNQYRLETTGIDLCGLCEYDLPPVGENGQTAECPGFYVNDCFKWRGPEEG
jgi:chromosome segregation ATPase